MRPPAARRGACGGRATRVARAARSLTLSRHPHPHHPHPHHCRATPDDGADAPHPGDAKVQDNLAAMLRLQIGAEEVKDLVAREEEKLIASAERVRRERSVF